MSATLQTIRAFAAADARLVGRDALLRWLLLIPLGLALLARKVLPDIVAHVGGLIGRDLLVWYPMFMGYALLLIGPSLCGLIVGFLFLDQRDEGTSAALRVTPVPLARFVLWRLASPTLLCFVLGAVSLLLAGLAKNPLHAAVGALAAAPLAPLYAMTLAAFAQNKVQGLAVMKAAGVPLFAPILLPFVSGTWKAVLTLVPTAPIARALWEWETCAPLLWLAAAWGWSGLIGFLLFRRFRARG